MNYSSSSPGNYGGPPGSTGPPGPGTPIMPSPQDSSNSGGENMYTMMKPVPGGNMPGVSSQFIPTTAITYHESRYSVFITILLQS